MRQVRHHGILLHELDLWKNPRESLDFASKRKRIAARWRGVCMCGMLWTNLWSLFQMHQENISDAAKWGYDEKKVYRVPQSNSL